MRHFKPKKKKKQKPTFLFLSFLIFGFFRVRLRDSGWPPMVFLGRALPGEKSSSQHCGRHGKKGTPKKCESRLEREEEEEKEKETG